MGPHLKSRNRTHYVYSSIVSEKPEFYAKSGQTLTEIINTIGIVPKFFVTVLLNRFAAVQDGRTRFTCVGVWSIKNWTERGPEWGSSLLLSLSSLISVNTAKNVCTKWRGSEPGRAERARNAEVANTKLCVQPRYWCTSPEARVSQTATIFDI